MKKNRIHRKWIALAIAAAMLIGLCACGASGNSASQSDGGMVKTAETMDAMNTEAATEEMAGASAAGDPVELDTSAAATSQKLIKNIDMTVETTNYDELLAGIRQKVEALGGYVESSETSGGADTYSNRWGYMTLRIPADQLDSFVEQVEDNSNVTYKSERVEDVTLSYVDMESHVKALRTEQETLMSMLEQATDLETIFAIQNQLTTVRYEIESYESQLRVLDNQVSYSTVYLNINEVERETSGEGKSFGEEVKNRLGDNMYRMGQNFRSFAIGFLGALPVIVIWVVVIVVIALVGRMVYKKVKRRQEKQKEEQKEEQK